jgi:putative ABC transport system permease protein
MRRGLSDLREATRVLRKAPRFTLVAALTLALGVGAVTSIFSVVNGVLLKPLPFPEPSRLVNVWSHAPSLGYDQFPLSPDLFFHFARENQVFESMALIQRNRVNLTGTDAPEVVDAADVTHEYFPTFAAPFVRGRTFRADEDAPDAPRVVIVGHRFWSQRFGADATLVGKTLQLDGEPTQVVGIAPPALDRQGSPDLFRPSRMNRQTPPQGNFGWNAIARLKPGVAAGDAAAHLVPIVNSFLTTVESPTYRAFITEGGYRPLVHQMQEDEVGDLQRPLWILLGTVGMLLLIACANVANLFLIRAEGRQREIAVRTALGATRGGLVRRMLSEAFVLSCLGSALGLLVAGVALPLILQRAPASIPRLENVSIDPWVVLFSAGAAIVSALLIGLVPALRYTRAQSLAALRHGGRGGTEEPARRRSRNVLVVVQTAMALILLIGSGLLLRSFSRLVATDLGFDPAEVTTFRIALPVRDYKDAAAAVEFHESLLARITAVGGVESAGVVSVLPVANASPGTAHEFEDHPVAPGALPPMVHYKIAAPAYFPAMRIPVTQGRNFDSRDRADGARNVLVNEALAAKYWPGQPVSSALGKRVRAAGGRDGNSPPPPWFTVVGVVGTERQDGLREPERPLIYYPLNPAITPGASSFNTLDYVVRGPESRISATALRDAVWSLDRNLPVAAVRTMREIIDRSIVEFTFTMLTLGIASAMALVLGAIGLYGVLSYAVTLRTREIGVRLALGAPPSRVMRSVVANGALIVGIGVVIGLAGAAALTRFMAGLLFETEPLDPATFAITSAALFLVALAASYLPARRAAHVSPLESMRTE